MARVKQVGTVSAKELNHESNVIKTMIHPPMDETNGGRHSKIGMNFMAMGPEALARMALVLEQGAVAHNDPDGTNWRRVPCEVHLNHLLYHINAWQRGVVGEDHLAHALCRAMMACETEGGGQWRS